MCDRDCFHCCKPDCDNDDLTRDERISQDVRDRFALYDRKYGAERKMADYERTERARERRRNYEQTEKAKERRRRYRQSKKGKETIRQYNSSEKGKERQKRYIQSEKGQEAIKRRNQKNIASGKNAEYCRAYYQRKKEKMFREVMEGGVE